MCSANSATTSRSSHRGILATRVWTRRSCAFRPRPSRRIRRSGCRCPSSPSSSRFLDRDKLADVYASADICVLPSRTETCGLVALEAMASGLAVVAADAGGFRESITHRRSGLLVSPDDAAGFASEILSLVIAPQRRAEIATGARAGAVARDVAPENLELLKQYESAAGLAGAGVAPFAA